MEIKLPRNYCTDEESTLEYETWYYATDPEIGLPTSIDMEGILLSYKRKVNEKYSAYYHSHIPRYRVAFSRNGMRLDGEDKGDIEFSQYYTALYEATSIGRLDGYVVGYSDSLESIIYGKYDPSLNDHNEIYWRQ